MAEAWTEVRVLCPLGWQELVGDLLARQTGASVAFGRPSLAAEPVPAGFELVRAFLPAREDSAAARARIAAALGALGVDAAEPELLALEASFKELPPEDYASSWKKAWKPFRVGRVAVVPPWHAGASRASDIRVVYEPQSAFGSGRHATTRTCLRLLQELVHGGERVLDAGTGSGLLAVVAVKLGARAALGFDIDPNSPPGATALAARNGVGDACEFRLGDFTVLGEDERGFDLALANIYADVLQAHAAELRARLREGGVLLASGIHADHVAATRARLEAAGFHVARALARGRWHTLVLEAR